MKSLHRSFYEVSIIASPDIPIILLPLVLYTIADATSQVNDPSVVGTTLSPQLRTISFIFNCVPVRYSTNRIIRPEMSEPSDQDILIQPADIAAPSLGFRFPFELQKIILGYLKKYELKQVRLVSKTCSSLATPLLFNRVYVSLKQLDLEVFTHCATHPVISSTIKEIIYDLSLFDPNITRHGYCRQLARGIPRQFYSEPFENPSHPYQHFVNEYCARVSSVADICRNHENDAYVVEGYQLWQDHARQERYAMENGRFLSALQFGLQNFSKLSSIVMTNELFRYNIDDSSKLDRSKLRCDYSGSPVTRRWNPLHARPTSEGTDECIISHFLKLTSALSSSGVCLQKFDLCRRDLRGFPLRILRAVKKHCGTLLQDCLDAYSDVENLYLRVHTRDEDDCVSKTALGILPDLLGEMQWLKNLELFLCRFYSDRESYFTYDQVFPRDVEWNHLTRLTITSLSFEGFDFINLLLWQMPSIRVLNLFDINLLQGAWEGVIEALRGANLTEFTLGNSDLMHQTDRMLVYGPAYTNHKDALQGEFIEAIEYYVVCGGRHPCLPPDAEPIAAQGYYRSFASEENLIKLIAGAKVNGIVFPPDPGSKARLVSLPD